MNRHWQRIALLFLMGLLPGMTRLAPARPPRPLPSAGEIDAMRQDLQQRQRQREGEQEIMDLVPWQPLSVSVERPRMRTAQKGAIVRLASRMRTLNAIWTFEPDGKTDAKPVQVLVCWPGEQWITFEPGPWRVSLAAGRPDGGPPLRLPPRRVMAEPENAYELALTGGVEQQLKERIREAEKKREEKALQEKEKEKGKKKEIF